MNASHVLTYKKIKHIIIACLSLLVVSQTGFSQEFSIKQVELTSEGIALHYDLEDTARNRYYTIHVFSSKDDFIQPLARVTGDVGLDVRPGSGKKIVWDPKEFGADFRGNIELEVRGKVYIPFVQFTNMKDLKTIKRARATTLTWTGGTRQNILNFNLYRDGELITVIPNVANSGNYDIVIPRSVKPGSDYYFIVSDSKNKDQMMKTTSFSVKPRVKLIFKILPVLAVGGAVYLLLPEPLPDPLEDPYGPPESQE